MPETDEPVTYRGLFRRPEFPALFAAQLVSMLGTMVADVALTVLVFSRTGSPLLAAATYTVGFLPYLLGGALLSGLVDRAPARRVMVCCDLAAAVFFALMTVPRLPLAGLFALEFAAGLVAPVFAGARASVLPDMLGDGAVYVLGRSVMQVVSQGSQVIGFAVGGLLLVALGARWALAVDALSFLASAALVRLGTRYRPPAATAAGSLLGDSVHGLRTVLAHPGTRRLLLLRWLVPTCGVAPEALAAPYVAHLHQPPSTVGLYLAAIPVGMVLASVVTGRFLSPAGQRRMVLPAAALVGVALLGFAAAPGLGPALALLVVVGLGYCFSLPLDAVLLRSVPPDLRNRALAVDQAGLMFLQGIGFTLWGAVGEALPLTATVTVAGIGTLAVVAALGPRVLPARAPENRWPRAGAGA